MKDTLFTTSSSPKELSSELLFSILTNQLSALEQPSEFSASKRCTYTKNSVMAFDFSIMIRKST